MQEPVREQKVEAVERALTILDAFGDGAPRLTLAEISRRTGFYRSTILRLAASLERRGYLLRDGDGQFRLGPTLWRLGVLYQNAFDLADHVRPVLARLVADTDETAAFYVREGSRRICLYRAHSRRMIRHHLEEGADLPLDRGASAHVLMAFTGAAGPRYDTVRAEGCCISLGERDPETASVAVPVMTRTGHFAGALGLVGLRSHFDAGRVATLRDAAQREAAVLGARLN